MAASYSYILLATLDLGIRLRLGHRRGICIVDAFIIMVAGKALPSQFRPPNSFSFPKREFGSKQDKRFFRADWCQQFEWLHYDVGADAAS